MSGSIKLGPLAHELFAVQQQVAAMGDLAEIQFARAIQALLAGDLGAAGSVAADEPRMDAFEVAIDRDLVSILARRQPAARDLRLLLGLSKTVTYLERIGDEADRIALRVTRLPKPLRSRVSFAEIQSDASVAGMLLRSALKALQQRDTELARAVYHDAKGASKNYEGLARKLMTYMATDMRLITGCLELLAIAKAVERVGGHARSLAQAVVYMVEGEDVRELMLGL